jgi:signal transduction histidine kinase
MRNAIRYSPAETAISVRVKLVGSNAEIIIRDQGPGVPDDQLIRIFDPCAADTEQFAQTPPIRKRPLTEELVNCIPQHGSLIWQTGRAVEIPSGTS